jgi:thousand and one amino acid protein kinase
MLLRHHEMTQELETKQQRSVHGIREGQLTTQHRTELGNQVCCLVLLLQWRRSQ